MSDTPTIKVQKEYKSPPNVTSEVPGKQNMREVDNNTENTSEIKITGAEFTLSPVMSVTTNETSITRADLKTQKVTVTEDISMDNNENRHRVRNDGCSLLSERQADRTPGTSERETVAQGNMDKENNQDGKSSRIPVGNLRQAVEKMKKEKEQKSTDKPRRSSIPKLKDAKIAIKRGTSLQIHPKTEDEFDKLYEEIVDNSPKDIDEKILAVKIEDTEKVESKFEELIHAYDEEENDVQPVTRISKIPALLKREDDRLATIGSSADKVKTKNTITESKLKDGGFKVTASAIKTKRISRSNSRDLLNKDDITAIDIKGNEENEVISRKKADIAYVPERKVGQRVDMVIKKQDFKNFSEVTTVEEFKDGDKQTIVTKTTINENVELTPEETRRILRSISREVKKDNQKAIIFGDLKNNANKTVTVEEFIDGDNTITTTTTVVDTVKVCTPVVHENIAQNISREMSIESKNFEIKDDSEVIIKNSDGNTRITKEIIEENVKVGIPVPTERFTRNISREIGNLKPIDNKNVVTKEVVKDDCSQKVIKKTITKETVKEGIPAATERGVSKKIKNDDQNNDIIKKELSLSENETKKNTMKADKIVKDNVRTGIPVFNRVTQTYSKGKVQHVEMSKTIEWRPADEIKTKKFNRSLSEKLTKKELKDIGDLKYEVTDISEVTNISDQSKVKSTTKNYNTTEITQHENDNSVTKSKTSKVTEYKTEEQGSNIDKQTFTFRNKVDTNVEKDFNKLRRIGKQTSLIEFKEERSPNTLVTKQYSYNNKEFNNPDTKDEKKKKVDTNLLKTEQDSDTEEVTILKGNVSRLKNKLIIKEHVEVPKQDTDEELPKKKSILSKIAVFERLETKEYNPINKKPSERSLEPNKIVEERIAEKSKIIDELLKEQPKRDFNIKKCKVEIGLNYEEVRYVDTPVIVEEFWKNEGTVSAVNPIIPEELPVYETPEIIDFTTNENPNEAIPTPKEINYQTKDYKSQGVKSLPGTYPTTNDNNTVTIKNEITRDDQFELPSILPAKINYEAEIGKSKPGKIDLNIWKSQVKGNKTLVDKKDVLRNESLEEIAKTLPGKVSKTCQSQTQVGKALPKKIDIEPNGANNEIANPLPAYISLETKPIPSVDSRTLLNDIDFNQNEAKNLLPSIDDKPNKTDGISSETATSQLDKINIDVNKDKAVINSLPKTMADKNDLLPIKVDDHKPKPGKINLSLWKSKILENKTLADKSGRAKETIGIGKTNFRSEDNQVGKPLPVTMDLKGTEKVKSTENATVISKKIENTVDGSKPNEIDGTLPAKTNLLTDEIPEEFEKVSPKIYEDKVQDTDRVPVMGYLDTDQNLIEEATILLGVVDFGASENEAKLVDDAFDNNGLSNPNIQDPGPRESFSPELVDEPETKVEINKTPIMSRIRSKLYFITNKSKMETATNTPVKSEISVANDTTENLQDVENIQTNLSSNGDKNNVQNSGELKPVETIPTKNIEENNNQSEYEPQYITHRAENTPIETANQHNPQRLDQNNKDYKITNENEFNFNSNKVQNELTRSAYGYQDNKIRKENMKRTKSLAELDLGDVTEGQVRRIVGRLKSVDFGRRESVKAEKINIREMPKKMSVLEKIALFEGKTQRTTCKMDKDNVTPKVTTTTTTAPQTAPEEEYLQKIEELTTAKTKYGRLEDMLYIPLSNGAEIPMIALGTAMMEPRLIPHLIGAAIDLGYRAIDTAYVYGNEMEIGQAIRAKIDDGTVKREDLFIMSKLWSTNHRTDLVEVACRNSLRVMGLEYFDLYMIHNPMSLKEGPDPMPKVASVLQYSDYDYLDAWFGMEELVTKQLVKNIGVSNFNSQQIQRILDKGRIRPVVNQVECHPYLSQQRLDAFCAERGIALSCFGTLGSKGTPADYKSAVPAVIDDPLVKVMASGLNVSASQLLIRYQIECGHNVVAKSSTAARLWDNLQALTFTLDQTQVDALHALNRNKRIFTFKGMGDTHRNYPFHIGF